MLVKRLPRSVLPALLIVTLGVLRASDPGPLVWSDEFNQPEKTAPDPAKWIYDLGDWGWGNQELENYTNSRANSYIIADADATDGKALAITAVKTAAGGYTSARLKTEGKFSFSYGRVAARLKATNGRGLWPAFWMLGDNIATVNWPTCGEIDVMEIIGATPTVAYGTSHGPRGTGQYTSGSSYSLPGGGRYDTGYHVFAVDWSPGKLVFSVDGVAYHTVTRETYPPDAPWVFDNSPFFLLLNLAVGGTWPGNPDSTTVFPQTYSIDYVRVYALANLPPGEAAGIAADGTHVRLTWLPAPGANSAADVTYEVTRALDAEFTRSVTTFGPVSGTSFLDDGVAPATQYFYRVATASGEGRSTPSAAVTVTTPAAVETGTARLFNLSARAYGGTGNQVAIAGFVITGTGHKPVLIRAVGPTLSSYGLNPGDLMADPTLELHSGNRVIGTSDDWGDGDAAAIATAAAQVGAGAFAGSDAKSAAMLLDLAPGVYSFIAKDRADRSGIVLTEVYDVAPAAAGARLANISSRAYCGSGDRVAIGGFVVSGGGSQQVLVRAIGPTLTSQQLDAAEILADPLIELHGQGNAVIALNDDWLSGGDTVALAAASARVGAIPLIATDRTSSALLVRLPKGVYSFVVRARPGTAGIVVAEVYAAD